MYDFAIGKLVWDRWLVGNAFRRDMVTIDVTNTTTVVHQNGPWYQVSQENPIVDKRKTLEESREVLINQSFDYYEKTIISGTRWKSVIDNDKIKFIKKDFIPDED